MNILLDTEFTTIITISNFVDFRSTITKSTLIVSYWKLGTSSEDNFSRER